MLIKNLLKGLKEKKNVMLVCLDVYSVAVSVKENFC